MEIKVGDKVRIKTKQELLAEGWHKSAFNDYFNEEGWSVQEEEVGCIETIIMLDDADKSFLGYYGWQHLSAIAEVIPPTLDEYICSLPLEERAKWFIHSRYDSEYDCHRYFSIVTYDSYFDYSEALQATIEALKQPKEN